MSDVEAERSLKQYGLSVLCAAVLLFVAFFGAYSGNRSQSERQSPPINVNPQVIAAVEDDNKQEKNTDILLTIFTSLLVGVGFLQYLSLRSTDEATKRAANAAQKSADAAQKSAEVATQTLIMSRRAWVRADVKPSSSLTLDRENTKACVSVTVTNVGNTPALHVFPHVRLAANIKGDNVCSLLKVHRDVWQKARSELSSNGIALFSDERFPKTALSGYFDSVPAAAEINWDLAFSKKLEKIPLYLVGCVDYTFATDHDNHH